MKKKKNRRSNTKFPALNPALNLKTRTDLIDYDYLDQLSDKDKEWLNRFTEEYTHAKFRHKGPKIQTKKEHIKDSYDRNNSRNRDILTRVKATGKLKPTETIREKDIKVLSPEEELILKEEVQERLDAMKFRKRNKK
jgi:hypothetical protein